MKLILGDCLEVMKSMADNSVDCVITDPPYGIERGSGTINKVRGKGNYSSGLWQDNREYVQTCVIPALHECLRIASVVIVTPGNVNLDLYPQAEALGVFYQPASVGLNRWGRADATVILYYGRDPRIGKTIQPCSFVLTERPSCKEHPCSKPLEAWIKLLLKGSLNNATVMDPFMGSGTTGVACERMGREFIGIEIDPEYFAIAEKRIKAEQERFALFAEATP